MVKYCNDVDCNDGKLFDRVSKRLIACPYCEQIKSDMIENKQVTSDDESFSEKLGFRRMFHSLEFNMMSVLGKYTYNELEREPVIALSETLSRLVNRVSSGHVPTSSLLIYLGSKADIELMSFYIVGSAYKAELSWFYLLTPSRLRALKPKSDEYNICLTADILTATFNPAISDDVSLMVDLLKERAYNGKPTIFLIGSGGKLNGLIQNICSFDETTNRLDLCLYMGVPKSPNEDKDKLKRVNNAIKNGNNYLKTVTPLLSIEDISGSGIGSQVVTTKNVPKMTSKDVFGY